MEDFEKTCCSINSYKNVSKNLKSMRNKTSSGHDVTTREFLKCSPLLEPYIVNCFYECAEEDIPKSVGVAKSRFI